MFEHMQSAEETSRLIAEIYYRASQYLSKEAQEVFEKYMSRHNLTEEEARQLLNTLQDPASIQELLEKLQGGVIPAEKAEILRVLESQAYRARIERFEQLQTQIDRIMKQVYRQEKQLQEQHYIDLAREAYYKSMFDIQQRASIGFSFSHIDQKQIDRVINTKWSGKNYSARIWKNTQGLAQDLKEEMLLGLLTGKTEREMSLEISKKYAQGAFCSRRLVRTESSYLTNQMEMQSYQECGVDRYIYLATLDLRTCDKCCIPFDGKIFAVADQEPGKNCPPMHPWCRCTTIAYISAEALAGMKRRARDPVTGHTYLVPGSMNYREWYAKYVKGNPEAEAKVKASRNASEDRKQFEEYKKLIGKDMPKSFADFQNLKYNEPKKWELLGTYARSVDKGMISPLSGFKNYQKIYDEINETVVGIKTSDGTAVTRQSKHFMERVIGTMKDPKTGRPRSGVTVEGIRDALENPAKVFPVRTDSAGEKSQKYIGRNGTVSINPDKGSLIQCNPTDTDYIRRMGNGNAKI